MQSEIDSINRLKNPNSKVSCHYLILRNGAIIQMIKDRYVAWHAGKSKWKKYVNLNANSIGIELTNKGHEYGYQNFTNKQISSLIQLCKKIKKKYAIKTENFLGHSDIAPLRKIDPGEKFPWKKLSEHNIGRWFKLNSKNVFSKIENKKKRFFQNLYNLGYRYFNIHKRELSDKKVIQSFQMHYLPNNISGKIDQKTLKISCFLINKV
tara:strand:- start:114 stop:737 length:624 start_codon:yes stop_codon:yes gene_type:complete